VGSTLWSALRGVAVSEEGLRIFQRGGGLYTNFSERAKKRLPLPLLQGGRKTWGEGGGGGNNLDLGKQRGKDLVVKKWENEVVSGM